MDQLEQLIDNLYRMDKAFFKHYPFPFPDHRPSICIMVLVGVELQSDEFKNLIHRLSKQDDVRINFDGVFVLKAGSELWLTVPSSTQYTLKTWHVMFHRCSSHYDALLCKKFCMTRGLRLIKILPRILGVSQNTTSRLMEYIQACPCVFIVCSRAHHASQGLIHGYEVELPSHDESDCDSAGSRQAGTKNKRQPDHSAEQAASKRIKAAPPNPQFEQEDIPDSPPVPREVVPTWKEIVQLFMQQPQTEGLATRVAMMASERMLEGEQTALTHLLNLNPTKLIMWSLKTEGDFCALYGKQSMYHMIHPTPSNPDVFHDELSDIYEKRSFAMDFGLMDPISVAVVACISAVRDPRNACPGDAGADAPPPRSFPTARTSNRARTSTSAPPSCAR